MLNGSTRTLYNKCMFLYTVSTFYVASASIAMRQQSDSLLALSEHVALIQFPSQTPQKTTTSLQHTQRSFELKPEYGTEFYDNHTQQPTIC